MFEYKIRPKFKVIPKPNTESIRESSLANGFRTLFENKTITFTSTIVGLLVVLILSSCAQQTAKENLLVQKESRTVVDKQRTIKIENGPNRGTFFTNSQGIEYSHSHKTISITNESNAPITLQIALPNEYALPAPFDREKFKIVLWPEKLTPEKDIFIDSISAELRTFFESDFNSPHRLSKVLEPSQEYLITIGTWHIPTDSYASVVGLSFPNEEVLLNTCIPLMNSNTPIEPSFLVRLNLTFSGVGCRYIPFGEISNSQN